VKNPYLTSIDFQLLVLQIMVSMQRKMSAILDTGSIENSHPKGIHIVQNVVR
jgi:hypothetical protein